LVVQSFLFIFLKTIWKAGDTEESNSSVFMSDNVGGTNLISLTVENWGTWDVDASNSALRPLLEGYERGDFCVGKAQQLSAYPRIVFNSLGLFVLPSHLN
jgi:hypothetical protein